MAQVVDPLPSKHKALILNLSTAKKNYVNYKDALILIGLCYSFKMLFKNLVTKRTVLGSKTQSLEYDDVACWPSSLTASLGAGSLPFSYGIAHSQNEHPFSLWPVIMGPLFLFYVVEVPLNARY
jgi:hypothetical protein